MAKKWAYEVWDMEAGKLVAVRKSKQTAEKVAAKSPLSRRVLKVEETSTRANLWGKWK